MTDSDAPQGSARTANRPYGESVAGMSTRPPALCVVSTAASAEETAKHAVHPCGRSPE